MEVENLVNLWTSAFNDILQGSIPGIQMDTLARQTHDSIRRIDIYQTYQNRAIDAASNDLPYKHTSNPLVLGQRPDLDVEERFWIIFLATYFGKSNKSKWTLFKRAAFDPEGNYFSVKKVSEDLENYFHYISSSNFFEGSSFSNHRKFTTKKLNGKGGFFQSTTYFIHNYKDLLPAEQIDFDSFYKLSRAIPSFGRLGAFDFTCSLVKCNFNISEPLSMYITDSTGPNHGLEKILRLTQHVPSFSKVKLLSEELILWFSENSDIFMVAQVLEDAVCNWQKNTRSYIRYFG